ncbi:hypothetical protein H0H93_000376 [Arthromyces matolae]|nr:hypothetical protein H0H93_000376 [Arthromyces matolae]
MITLRRERIVLFVLVIVVVTIFTWNFDFLGPSETLIEYEPPLRPLVQPHTRVPITADPIKTATSADADTDADTDVERLTIPERPKTPNDNPVDLEGRQTVIGPFTTIPEGAHSPGFTLLHNLYLRNGTFFIITPDVSKIPSVPDMISQPRELAENVDLTPTSEQMEILGADDVESILGKHAIRVKGLSVIVYDPPQFLTHLYHWWGEIILGASRVLSVESSESKEALVPDRFLLPFSDKGAYRDGAGVNAPLMRAAWPSAQIEDSDYWKDLIALDATVVFDKVMLVNRPAAHRHPWGNLWFKMIAGTMNVTAPDNFWEPIRQNIVRNFLGYLPTAEPTTKQNEQSAPSKPLVTYVSRQHAGTRRLRTADHEALLSAFENLQEQGVCEFREVRMEELSLRGQVELAARSTLLMELSNLFQLPV